MSYKRFYIWVEGGDDERFFEKIVKPILLKKYDFVEITRYAHLKKDKINNYLKSIEAMDADYIFTTDINKSPCVTHRKDKITNKINKVRNEKILIIVPEIEGWYFSGLEMKDIQRFKLPTFESTETLSKESFNKLIPKRFDSRIDFMQEILKKFSINVAKRQNKSFAYFVEKYF